jgi:signal transduction histidine kinase
MSNNHTPTQQSDERRQLTKLKQLQKENEELVNLNRSKDEFVAIASHQLRTPATAVKQYLGLLLEGYTDPLTDGQRTFLQLAYENNDRQLHIVDEILHITRLDLDKVKLNLEKVDVCDVVRSAMLAMRRNFENRNQKVEVKLSGRVEAVADKEQLRRALENLLENASNYSPDKRKISVGITHTEEHVDIFVKDEGVGIDPKDFPKLFQKFSRIPNPLSIEVSGTGLGLYWAQKIIRLQGGDILVESSLDKGSTFSIRLPK